MLESDDGGLGEDSEGSQRGAHHKRGHRRQQEARPRRASIQASASEDARPKRGSLGPMAPEEKKDARQKRLSLEPLAPEETKDARPRRVSPEPAALEEKKAEAKPRTERRASTADNLYRGFKVRKFADILKTGDQRQHQEANPPGEALEDETGRPPGQSVAMQRIEEFGQQVAKRTLDLRYAAVGEWGAERLARALRPPRPAVMRNMRVLQLGGNYIGDGGVDHLAKGIEDHCALQILVLFWNGIGDAGGGRLSKTVRKVPSLEELNLACNRIGNDGAKQLAKALAQKPPPRLSKLDLSDNLIGQDVVQDLHSLDAAKLWLNLKGNRGDTPELKSLVYRDCVWSGDILYTPKRPRPKPFLAGPLPGGAPTEARTHGGSRPSTTGSKASAPPPPGSRPASRSSAVSGSRPASRSGSAGLLLGGGGGGRRPPISVAAAARLSEEDGAATWPPSMQLAQALILAEVAGLGSPKEKRRPASEGSSVREISRRPSLGPRAWEWANAQAAF